jgi:hypothetical protein
MSEHTDDHPNRMGLRQSSAPMVVILLLFAAYMGSYYWIVGPYPTTHLTGKHLWNWQRFGGREWPESTPTVFRPALWIDSRVRPDKWLSKPTDPLDN